VYKRQIMTKSHLNEYTYRYNNQGKNGDQFRKLLLRAALSH